MSGQTNPKVSFIVPVYNVAEYIEECIKSIAEQQLRNIEIVLIDDGSTDASGKICDKFAQKDKRIKVFHQKNAGVSAARNAGIEKACGEWICFVDGDDTISNRFGEYIRENEEDNEILLFLWTRKRQFTEEERVKIYDLTFLDIQSLQCATLNKYQKGRMKYSVLEPTSACAKAFRKNWLIEKQLRFPTGIVSGEDTFFNLNAFGKAGKVRSVYAPVYYYRCNTNSVTRRYNPELKSNFAAVENLIEQYISKNEREDLQRSQYLYKVSAFMFIALQDYCHPDNTKSFKERKKDFLELRKEIQYEEAFQKAQIGAFPLPKAFVCQLCKNRCFWILCLLNQLQNIKKAG